MPLNSDFEEVKDAITEQMQELRDTVDVLDIDEEAKQYLFGEATEVHLGVLKGLDSLSKCVRRMEGLVLTSGLLAKRYKDE